MRAVTIMGQSFSDAWEEKETIQIGLKLQEYLIKRGDDPTDIYDIFKAFDQVNGCSVRSVCNASSVCSVCNVCSITIISSRPSTGCATRAPHVRHAGQKHRCATRGRCATCPTWGGGTRTSVHTSVGSGDEAL